MYVICAIKAKLSENLRQKCNANSILELGAIVCMRGGMCSVEVCRTSREEGEERGMYLRWMGR